MVFDHCLPKLFAQIAMHDSAGAADYATRWEHEHLLEAVQQRLDAAEALDVLHLVEI